MIPRNYQLVLAFAFAIHEINKNEKLLPNITLGSKIYDNVFNPKRAFGATLDLLFTGQGRKTNYKCDTEKNLMAVIGGLTSENSIQMANILNTYKIPQLSYATFDPALSDKTEFPSLFWMAPNESAQYIGIIQLLNYFGWNWIDLLIPDNDNGERFLRTFSTTVIENSICISSIHSMPIVTHYTSNEVLQKSLTRTASMLWSKMINVILVYGDVQSMESLRIIIENFEFLLQQLPKSVWIISAQWDVTAGISVERFAAKSFNGSLSFSFHTNVVPGFQHFLENLNPYQTNLYFIHEFWFSAFLCSFPQFNMHLPNTGNCTGQEKLESLSGTIFEMEMSGQSYSIYNAVYAVAHALHAMHSFRAKQRAMGNGDRWNLQKAQPWMLLPFLRNIHFNNSAGEEIFFDANGDLISGYDVINLVTYPNKSFQKVQVGRMDPQNSSGKRFTINGSAITWNPKFIQTPPDSRCVESCQSGYCKIVQEGKQECCYYCIQCAEGSISTDIDATKCEKCPDNQYPNKKRNQCIPKRSTYLSYEEPLGAILTSCALLFSAISVVVMWIFIYHWNTAIVKANNGTITCTLLFSLLLCFLCSFLFLGRPGKVSCTLRQTVFGILFTIVVSCVLAKTITVILAFRATKPGCKIRKWVGMKLGLSVIIFCSLIQIGICVAWLAVSPPFPESDTYSQVDQIMLQCNEGSDTMFYLVLGYMWLLAIISFIVAFFARQLPDSFNEAKLITFSMLIFCCVWVSFVPSYLSTKGKYMVAVEICSILASSFGFLGFFFLPKCYIILAKPELNTRKQLVSKKW
ncbi:vomeronasal type-2 receptor 26-like [Sceloporus undulatus]|uniref:vomeronasal type-2 receptor 26-like n=1 Tax=Sceloporus undulatus TaxID=8520 RepID=UPI001C4B37DD|nr:vomeronasal type-2 receptor 26-like [Sceloporus undulatus]